MSNQSTQPITHSQLGSTTWDPRQYADLSLPDGKSLVGTCPTEQLRVLLAPFVEHAHTLPRLELVAQYAKTLKGIFDNAGERAVTEWWAEKRGSHVSD